MILVKFSATEIAFNRPSLIPSAPVVFDFEDCEVSDNMTYPLLVLFIHVFKMLL